MKKPLLTLLLVVFCSVAAHAGPVTKAAELAAEAAAKVSGKPFASSAARKAAIDEAGRVEAQRGADGLRMIEDGGLEFLQAIPRYGDELVHVAKTASPEARRALALDVPTLLPLAKRYGVEVLEVEAKAPGQAERLFRVFGAEEGRQMAKSVPVEDLPRLLKYGELADSDHTRRLLMDAYRKEGAGLFARIPPRLVLAGGLTASMLWVADGVSDAIKVWMAEHPVLAAMVFVTPLLLLVVLLLWRFGLMPWQRRVSPTDSPRTDRNIAS